MHSKIAPSMGADPEEVVFIDTLDEEEEDKWPHRSYRVPDIMLHKSVDFAQHVQELLRLNIKFFQPYLGTNYTKICSYSLDDHRSLVNYFDKHKLPYHTFSPPHEKFLRVIIRGLPKNVSFDKLKEKLESENIPVKQINLMNLKDFAKHQNPLVLVVVPHNDEGMKILRLVQVLGHKVTVEPPIRKTRQCFRCQKWGHAQRFCHGIVKCVKCAGDHNSDDCTKDANEPPTCANCGGNHTASHRECFYCPDSEEYKQNRLKKIKNLKEQPKTKCVLVTMENFEARLYKRITYIPHHSEAIPF